MRVAEAVSALNGVLLNTPSISAFNGFSQKLEKIQNGWLFIAPQMLDSVQITQAIQNGAYGIALTKQNAQDFKELIESQNEIAWIEVQDLSSCIARLIRYKILFFSTNVIALNSVQFAIAKEIITDKKAFVGNEKEALLESFNNEITTIFTDSQKILELSFETLTPIKPLSAPFNLISYTLFDVRFFYAVREYLLHLPYLFIDDLSALVAVCEQERVSFELSHFKEIAFLKPNFVDRFLNLCDYGQSQQVLITCKDSVLFAKYINYFSEYARWGKLACLVPKSYKIENPSQSISHYAKKSEIISLIKNKEFNFMLIFGIDDSELFVLLEKHKPRLERSLFDEL
ncbi:hypothetical protein CQA49_01970 [Helicobacter sp. MIT 00-7814]|uniref:hypothetical protein n=1 Tax=unclassified Helicobacter TaxID=2593540 RepID=UPI000E1F4193|nr:MULTISPECIES: hypothetical protein [unclassified Helicobacter]RDU56170.1 hypothetical protein CQA37_02415 [Helicobacter sp. MIT 99-10781]RDU56267.1 hypothetical protein CQA49_01970 [Helicobacter sp. MIT 00-7814]